jgi:hypothetical protein
MKFRLVNVEYDGVKLASEDGAILLDLDIFSRAWTYRFHVDLHSLGNFYCERSETVNIILENLDRAEILEFIKSLNYINWVRRTELVELLALALRSNPKTVFDDYGNKISVEPPSIEEVCSKLCKGLYYAFYYELYHFEKPEVKRKYLERLCQLAKYYSSTMKWKSKLENVNVEEKLRNHQLKQLAKRIGRKDNEN